MPAWLISLLAALPSLVAEIPQLVTEVTTLIDQIIAIFQTATASTVGGVAPATVVTQLQTLRAAVVAAAATSKHRP